MYKIENRFYLSVSLLPISLVLGVLLEIACIWLEAKGVILGALLQERCPIIALILCLFLMIWIQIGGWRYLNENEPKNWREERLRISIILAPFIEFIVIIVLFVTLFE